MTMQDEIFKFLRECDGHHLSAEKTLDIAKKEMELAFLREDDAEIDKCRANVVSAFEAQIDVLIMMHRKLRVIKKTHIK
jgi:hypothetical protein